MTLSKIISLQLPIVRATFLRSMLMLVVIVAGGTRADAQLALKTNLLYWATTTPNIGAEVGLGDKTTGQVFYGLNP